MAGSHVSLLTLKEGALQLETVLPSEVGKTNIISYPLYTDCKKKLIQMNLFIKQTHRDKVTVTKRKTGEGRINYNLG